jgi:hypothetical protein
MRIQTRRKQIQELQGEVLLKREQIQELVVAQDNIMALVVQANKKYTGNRYKTYDSAIPALASAYAGAADWGVLQVGNIVDLRAAYIVGQGIKVSKVEPEEGEQPADREYEFAQRFIEANSLDHELPQDLAKEAEIEGKTLLKLFSREDEAQGFEGIDIILRWVSWTTNKYTVKVDNEDYLKIESVKWSPPDGKPPVDLTPEKCVYKRFAGRLDVPNETMPRTAKCLTQIEDLDKALWDWRRINELFAAPVPHIECETAAQAKEMGAAIAGINFLAGKAFAHTGTFSFAQPSSEGQTALENEIITKMKLISGTTGVPINALGAPELTTKMGADSQAQLDLIAMSTVKEREVWRGAYQEVIEKAMLMWNEETRKTPLRPWLIRVDLPVITEAQWNRIVSTWLPIRSSKEITQKTFLNQIPGLDVEKEIESLEAEGDTAMDRFADTHDDDPEGEEGADVETDASDRTPDGNIQSVTGQVLRYKSNPGNFAKRGDGK